MEQTREELALREVPGSAEKDDHVIVRAAEQAVGTA
jgi:hypothetical protein